MSGTRHCLGRAAVGVACLLGPWATSALCHSPLALARSNEISLLSTQFTPVHESEAFRRILSGAPVSTTFLPLDSGAMTALIRSQERARNVTVSAILGLHGDFPPLVASGYLEDVTPLLNRLKARSFSQNLVKLSMMGNRIKRYYVPFVQATYMLAVNKKALKYLPKGATVDDLTYDQWIAWGKNMERGTHRPMIGLPVGPGGLIDRFIQGYLYPSFAHSSGVREFRSPAAVKMWRKMKHLWTVTNRQSTTYTFMERPLLTGQVWVAWDHVARLADAVVSKPADFELVPAPSGPAGHGFMLVIDGIAIPKGAPNVRGTEQLIDYLTAPSQQIAVLKNLGFSPASNVRIPSRPPGNLLMMSALRKQVQSKHALLTLLPVGLGSYTGNFDQVFIDTFHRIVLDNENIRAVLNDESRMLRGLMRASRAKCWPPDKPSSGPCPVQ